MHMAEINNTFEKNNSEWNGDSTYYSHDDYYVADDYLTYHQTTFDVKHLCQDYNCSTYLFPQEKYLFISNLTLMLVSLLGNGYIMLFICGQKKARNAHNITIVSIAVADIAISVVVIPTYIGVSHYDMSNYNDNVTPFLCKIHKYIYHWCKTVKVFSILTMVVDRYYRVTKPTRNTNVTGRCIFFLSFVWFFGAAFNVWEIVLNTSALMTVEHHLTGYNTTIRQCISSDHFHFLQKGFKLSGLTVTYAIPLCAILILYTLIVIKGYYVTDQSLPLKSKRRLILSILSVTLFYLCQLPAELMEYAIFAILDVTWHNVIWSKVLDSLSFSQGVWCVLCYLACHTELHESWKDHCGLCCFSKYGSCCCHHKNNRNNRKNKDNTGTNGMSMGPFSGNKYHGHVKILVTSTSTDTVTML